MIELQGKYNKAKVFTDNIENSAVSQIIELCNQEFISGSNIRIMPDVHAGAGCTIGTTMTLKDKVVSNLVGVDIGCGVYTVKLGNIDIDFEKLDKIIRVKIPYGQDIHNKSQDKILHKNGINLKELKCAKYINLDRAYKSIGTLGGGNHYIELDKDSKGNIYLSIHTGSRYLGKQVAEHYQNIGIAKLSDNTKQKENIIRQLKAEGREKEIQKELKKIKPKTINKQLAYIENDDFNNYIHDMKIVQKYAHINRITIERNIISSLGLDNCNVDAFDTIHNYIDTDNMILRKGAISAQKEELLAIPMNMRDGVIIGKGKGNPDWNYSAPHGAGRLMSRRVAKESVNIEEFKNTMKGVYSTCINENTIDESPMAYKQIQNIVDNIKDTVDVIEIVKPIYNFKAN
ncbi:RNA-splicing ligase RtcB [Clostridium botulinum]|uniref:RNA-splicing ligase RtcB n=1 Tax=Clostridium botulinum TaxID=1491 RepID=UPI0004D422AF|nr:RNA-splicing ligase RtcB [Clostridium botulinum]KEH96456.1 RNA-splicing ligase RtcB [Clostridium botulinum D str. 16868]